MKIIMTNPELWDIYDSIRSPIGRTAVRGEPMPPEDFHLVVLAWILSADGRILLMKRSPEKHGGGLWSTPGGSAIAGEDSLTAVLRETFEESGIILPPDSGRLIYQHSIPRDNGGCSAHYDHWLFRHDINPAEITFQPGETCGYRFAVFNGLYE